VDVTEQTFATDVVERSFEVPVAVDFWAEWCGPCHALAPVLEAAVAEREGQVELAKVDVDANQELAREYDIRGIPAVKGFRKGRVVRELVGAQPPAAVARFLDSLTEPTEGERLLAELRESGRRPEVVEAIEREDYESALELLFSELQEAGGDPDEVRRLMVALFGELGQDHPVSTRYRKRLSAALY
jgi:putative thioredoxin